MRDLRGIGRGIEARLRELVETGEIAELAELERELAPGLVGLGRYLGLTAQAVGGASPAALGVHTPEEFRAAVADGRLRTVPGSARRSRRRSSRRSPASPSRGRRAACCSTRRGSSSAGSRRTSAARSAGDVRRWRDSCERLAVVCAVAEPSAVLARFAELPQIVAMIEQEERRAVGLTVEGVPVELVAAEPERFGTALLRATGAPAFVAPLEPLPDAPDEAAAFAALGLAWWPPELREQPPEGEPPELVETGDIRGDLHCHTTWSDGRASVAEMGRAAQERGYDYVAICDHTPAVGAVRGLTPDDVRRQAEEIAAANELLAPFRVLRGIECDILPDGRLDLPDDVLGGARLGPGERARRPAHAARGDDQAGGGGAAQSRTCAASATRRAG